MHFEIEVSSNSVKKQFAEVKLNTSDESYSLYFDSTPILKIFRKPSANTYALDFLFIASVIYAIDKLVSRKNKIDNWTRDLSVSIPVKHIVTWNRIKGEFEKLLTFLTGDIWSLSFRRLNSDLIIPNTLALDEYEIDNNSKFSLFSGGLDSLVGTIDLLEDTTQKVILIGHHDPDISNVAKPQRELFKKICDVYSDRSELLQVGIGIENSPSCEHTYRSRSLLFIALGVYCASYINENTFLNIPENGVISLNIPLSPSRRGSCSTRTTHPYYINSINELLKKVRINSVVVNPYKFQTKGEMIQSCKNQNLLKDIYKLSISCAKGGQDACHWIRPGASNCGRCMPCIYRQAALFNNGWVDEEYGNNILIGQLGKNNYGQIINIDSSGGTPHDCRVFLKFLRDNWDRKKVRKSLLVNGHIDINDLNQYVGLVQKVILELRNWIGSNANDNIKRRAGL